MFTVWRIFERKVNVFVRYEQRFVVSKGVKGGFAVVGSQTAVSHASKRERMWYYVHYCIVDAAASRSCFINYVFIFASILVECKRSFL